MSKIVGGKPAFVLQRTCSHLAIFFHPFFQAVWHYWLLRGVQQGDPRLRDGDARQDKRLPPGVLRLPAVQPQVKTNAYSSEIDKGHFGNFWNRAPP